MKGPKGKQRTSIKTSRLPYRLPTEFAKPQRNTYSSGLASITLISPTITKICTADLQREFIEVSNYPLRPSM
jgi:hypothetical protein